MRLLQRTILLSKAAPEALDRGRAEEMEALIAYPSRMASQLEARVR